MTKANWKKKIKKACEAAGTYQPHFDSVIDSLAGIMELRDNAQDKFDKLNGQTVIKHTTKTGAVNIVKNPALAIILDCNAQALAYWRDLGLTPAGLKRLGEKDMIIKTEKSTLADVLNGLGV